MSVITRLKHKKIGYTATKGHIIYDPDGQRKKEMVANCLGELHVRGSITEEPTAN